MIFKKIILFLFLVELFACSNLELKNYFSENYFLIEDIAISLYEYESNLAGLEEPISTYIIIEGKVASERVIKEAKKNKFIHDNNSWVITTTNIKKFLSKYEVIVEHGGKNKLTEYTLIFKDGAWKVVGSNLVYIQ